jgi:5-methylcytosine-specific restriction endonuclease McrA
MRRSDLVELATRESVLILEKLYDHLIPINVGGDDSLANLRPSCARCNRGWR